MQVDYQREMLAYDEKVALAELEEAKAAERVKELKFQKARFCMDYFLEVQKEREKLMQAQQQVPAPPPPPEKRVIIEGVSVGKN
jgi:hypothetical protein